MSTIDTPGASVIAGVASCDITPPVGAYHRMWGAAKHERSTGVHRPLIATALYLEATTVRDRQIFVALDHCLFWGKEMATLLDRVTARTGCAREEIAVCFSHTHGAGLMDLARANLPGGDLIEPYLEKLAGQISDLIDQARSSAQIARLTFGVGRCDLAFQRDFFDSVTGQYVCGTNPDGQADDTVQVIRITGPQDETLATLVNYACHPTTLAFENTLVSPDFVGAMREVVESATGKPCLFLQGASGDLGPREGFVGGPAVADRNGRQLGHAAISALESLAPPGTRYVFEGPVISGATLGIWHHAPREDAGLKIWKVRRFTVPLQYRPEHRTVAQVEQELESWQAREEEARKHNDEVGTRDARAMVERMNRWLTRLRNLPSGDKFPLPITILRTGDAIWVTVEGEHYQYLQQTLRARFPKVAIVVMTLVNGSRVSYLPTRNAYGKGIYQETVALVAAGELERLTDILTGEIGKILSDQDSAKK